MFRQAILDFSEFESENEKSKNNEKSDIIIEQKMTKNYNEMCLNICERKLHFSTYFTAKY